MIFNYLRIALNESKPNIQRKMSQKVMKYLELYMQTFVHHFQLLNLVGENYFITFIIDEKPHIVDVLEVRETIK